MNIIYDDLTVIRADEETVLSAVYGDDFCKKIGVWGSPLLTVNVRPDIPKERIGSQLTLCCQLSNKYPMVVPKIELQNVQGLTSSEISDLMKQLSDTAVSLSKTASPMVCDLVQIVEDFLFKHNRDPILANRSLWEKMRDKQEEKNRRMKEEEDRIQSFMNMELIEPNQNSMNRSEAKDDSIISNPLHMEGSDHMERVRKELERQREALLGGNNKVRNAAYLGFEMNDSDSDESSNSDDASTYMDDSDDDMDVVEASMSTTSRYNSDFIELGVLGKGGGGEVLKVKNRLDRRTCKCSEFI